jgi:hypothetical protein
MEGVVWPVVRVGLNEKRGQCSANTVQGDVFFVIDAKVHVE